MDGFKLYKVLLKNPHVFYSPQDLEREAGFTGRVEGVMTIDPDDVDHEGLRKLQAGIRKLEAEFERATSEGRHGDAKICMLHVRQIKDEINKSKDK